MSAREIQAALIKIADEILWSGCEWEKGQHEFLCNAARALDCDELELAIFDLFEEAGMSSRFYIGFPCDELPIYLSDNEKRQVNQGRRFMFLEFLILYLEDA